jgi:hypothetical protein
MVAIQAAAASAVSKEQADWGQGLADAGGTEGTIESGDTDATDADGKESILPEGALVAGASCMPHCTGVCMEHCNFAKAKATGCDPGKCEDTCKRGCESKNAERGEIEGDGSDDGQGDEDIDGGGGNALTDGVGVNDGSDVEIPFEVRGAGMWSLPYEYCAVYVLSPRRIGCESCMPNEIAKC